MFSYPASLSNTVVALRNDWLDLLVYVDAICDRIDAVEPEIQALLPEPDRRARLRDDAMALKERLPIPAWRPPLFGVPVGIKDLFNVDGFPTAAGSQLPPALFAGPEASCVTALRDAGALILGKTRMDEFAHSEPAPTRNPRRPDHTPGGSSSGSAAAVAAGFCPLGIGTQTLRSIIGPAAFCGLVGFKPSYARIPTSGMVLLARSLDTVGLLTQDLAGMTLAASLLCRDWHPVEPAARPVLGVPDGFMLSTLFEPARQIYETQLDWLAGAGYEIRRTSFPPNYLEKMHQRALQLLRAEMADYHSRWFADFETLYRPRTAAAIRQGQGITGEELAELRTMQFAFRAALEERMAAVGIDLWVTPSSGGPAPEGLEITGWVETTAVWSYAGLPAVSLPGGLAPNGLPLGLQFIAPCMADERLLAWSGGLARVLWHSGGYAWNL